MIVLKPIDHLRVPSASLSKWVSVRRLWIEEMILKLSGQSKRLSHRCTWKISDVFNGTRTNDHLDAGEELSATELRSHSDVSRERNVCEVWFRDELKKWSPHLLNKLSDCLICEPDKFQVSSAGFEPVMLWISVFIHIEKRINYHHKNFAHRLALKERLRGIRKGSILAH